MYFHRVKRREFITLLGGAAAAWPLAAHAQQPSKVSRVAVLMPLTEGDPEGQRRLAAFRQGLHEREWIIGQSLHIDEHWVGTDPARIRNEATSVLASNPDVILAATTLVVAPLRRLTNTVPIVFTNIADPVESGVVTSFAHPGGNLTGFTPLEFPMWGKSLGLLKEVAPALSRVAVIYNPEQGPQIGMLRAIEFAAQAFSVNVVPLEARGSFEQAIDGFAQEAGGGLIAIASPVIDSSRDVIIRAAARNKLPAIYGYRYYVTDGGLMSYGVDPAAQYKEAAFYVDRILRGANPGDLPIQTPTKFELFINLKTAKALGLEIPPQVLARADEVIE
jgi:putative ABC transport system substrate-binding protein